MSYLHPRVDTRMIALEGPDGCGKTAVAKALSEHLGARLMQEPGTTQLGLRLRELMLHKTEVNILPESLAMLFTAASFDVLTEAAKISDDKHTVVFDRTYISNFAYRYADGLEIPRLVQLACWLPRIPVVFYLKVSDEVRESRVLLRGGLGKDRFEGKGLEHQRRVAAGYDLCVSDYKCCMPGPVITVDGNGNIDQTVMRIVNAYNGLLSRLKADE